MRLIFFKMRKTSLDSEWFEREAENWRGLGAKPRSGVSKNDSSEDEHRHPELRDMLSYLERNYKKMTPLEQIEYHSRIVAYFKTLAHFKVPGTEGFDLGELMQLSAIAQRREQQVNLESALDGENLRLRRIIDLFKVAEARYYILFDHLKHDREALIKPTERQRLMEETSLEMEARVHVDRLFSGTPDTLDYAYQPKRIGQSSAQTSESTPLISSIQSIEHLPQALARDTREYLPALATLSLRDKVVEWHGYGFIMSYLLIGKERTEEAIAEIKGRVASVRLNMAEDNRLREFNDNTDFKFSTSRYAAACKSLETEHKLYIKQREREIDLDFFRRLSEMGVNVNYNVTENRGKS